MCVSLFTHTYRSDGVESVRAVHARQNDEFLERYGTQAIVEYCNSSQGDNLYKRGMPLTPVVVFEATSTAGKLQSTCF